ARDALVESEWKDRMEAAAVQRQLREGFVRKFLKDGLSIDLKNVEALLSEALSAAAAGCKILTHFIPCHVSSDAEPARFEIGPVSFQPTAAFLTERQGDFDRYVQEGSRELVELRKKWGQKQQADEALHYGSCYSGESADPIRSQIAPGQLHHGVCTGQHH